MKTAAGDNPYVGVPCFVSRAFRHTSIYVRTDRIREPKDLKGRKVGVPEYQLTANVWARAILEDDFGVKPADIGWIRGGIEEPGRAEKIALELPRDLRLEDAPAGTSLNALLADGAIDGFIGPRLPSCFVRGHPLVGRLFADPQTAAADYFRRTRIFPIMHLTGLRQELALRHPWLPAVLLKAFERSKAAALARLSDTAAAKVTLPFVDEQLDAAHRLMGTDFWPYGVTANRHLLETFLGHHHRQGLSKRRVAIDELFHPSTQETVRV